MQKSRVQHPKEDISLEVHVWMPTIRQWQQVKTAGPGPRQNTTRSAKLQAPCLFIRIYILSGFGKHGKNLPLRGTPPPFSSFVV